MLNNFRNKFFIFFLRILLIEDAVLLVIETHATKEIARVESKETVEGIETMEKSRRKGNSLEMGCSHHFVDTL